KFCVKCPVTEIDPSYSFLPLWFSVAYPTLIFFISPLHVKLKLALVLMGSLEIKSYTINDYHLSMLRDSVCLCNPIIFFISLIRKHMLIILCTFFMHSTLTL